MSPASSDAGNRFHIGNLRQNPISARWVFQAGRDGGGRETWPRAWRRDWYRQQPGGNISFTGLGGFIDKSGAEGKWEKGKGWANRRSVPELPGHAGQGKVAAA
jgi:hypothetical protein